MRLAYCACEHSCTKPQILPQGYLPQGLLTKGLVSHLVCQFGNDITVVGEGHLHDLYQAYFGCTEQCLLSLHCEHTSGKICHWKLRRCHCYTLQHGNRQMHSQTGASMVLRQFCDVCQRWESMMLTDVRTGMVATQSFSTFNVGTHEQRAVTRYLRTSSN